MSDEVWQLVLQQKALRCTGQVEALTRQIFHHQSRGCAAITAMTLIPITSFVGWPKMGKIWISLSIPPGADTNAWWKMASLLGPGRFGNNRSTGGAA